MEVYVVSKICDWEYFCTEVVFVTTDEQVAMDYCRENNQKDKCWDGITRDTVTYRAYELKKGGGLD